MADFRWHIWGRQTPQGEGTWIGVFTAPDLHTASETAHQRFKHLFPHLNVISEASWLAMRDKEQAGYRAAIPRDTKPQVKFHDHTHRKHQHAAEDAPLRKVQGSRRFAPRRPHPDFRKPRRTD